MSQDVRAERPWQCMVKSVLRSGGRRWRGNEILAGGKWREQAGQLQRGKCVRCDFQDDLGVDGGEEGRQRLTIELRGGPGCGERRNDRWRGSCLLLLLLRTGNGGGGDGGDLR